MGELGADMDVMKDPPQVEWRVVGEQDANAVPCHDDDYRKLMFGSPQGDAAAYAAFAVATTSSAARPVSSAR